MQPNGDFVGYELAQGSGASERRPDPDGAKIAG